MKTHIDYLMDDARYTRFLMESAEKALMAGEPSIAYELFEKAAERIRKTLEAK